MRRRLREGVIWQLVLLGAALPLSHAKAGEGLTAVPSQHGPEIMLYVALPIGAAGPPRVFGLRIDQHSPPSKLPGATANAADLAGRRELVNLSMAAHEHMRLDFGRRVSWDFSRQRLNLPSDLPSMRPLAAGVAVPGLHAASVARAPRASLLASGLPALP